MPSDLDANPAAAIELCRAAHARLVARVEHITDEQVRSPSRLPGWTVAHVLTHLARNADGHVRRLEGALRGEDVPRYPGGPRSGTAKSTKGRGGPGLTSSPTWTLPSAGWSWYGIAARRPGGRTPSCAAMTTGLAVPARCGGCARLRCITSISASATGRPTGRRTTSRRSCPCSWPRCRTGCTERTTSATWWRGCRAGGRSRPRLSLIRGDVRTRRPSAARQPAITERRASEILCRPCWRGWLPDSRRSARARGVKA